MVKMFRAGHTTLEVIQDTGYMLL